jgi:ATP-dependent DNA helicase RecG
VPGVITLDTPVQFIKGVGERRAQLLDSKGLSTAEDLLYYLPFRYEDRTRLRGPAEVRAGEMATVIAPVRSAGALPVRRGRIKIFCADVGERGSYLRCKWFNAPYLERIIKPGQYLALHGKVEQDFYEGGLQMIQPQYEILPDLPEGIAGAGDSLEVGRIVPIYEAAGGGRLTSRDPLSLGNTARRRRSHARLCRDRIPSDPALGSVSKSAFSSAQRAAERARNVSHSGACAADF